MQQAFCRFFVYDDFDDLLKEFERKTFNEKTKRTFSNIIKQPFRCTITNIKQQMRFEYTCLLVCLKGRLLFTYQTEDNESVSFIVDKPIALNGKYVFTCVPLDDDVIFYVAEVFNQPWETLVSRLPNKHATLADVVIAAV